MKKIIAVATIQGIGFAFKSSDDAFRGQENRHAVINAARVDEVQRYLSMTKRTWSAYHFLGNADAWKALPTEVQQIVERNLTKYTLLRRQDTTRLNSSLADKLQRLRAFYRRWKGEFGDTAWSLLEARAGRPV